MNKLILGDNLEILKQIDEESVDLIYLDPPFFSNRNYEVIWGDAGEIRSFQDRWSGGIDHYISWLKERVEQMYRILKSTGSIFLHCDWHANAEIKVFVLNKIFGEQNFKNEIIWKRTNTPKGSQFDNKQFGVVTDSIFWFSKTKDYFFDDKRIRKKINEDEIIKKYPKTDEKGRYYEYPILRSASKGARPNLVYEYKGFTPPFYGWVVKKEKLVEIDERGDLGWRENGQPFRKFRPHEDPGQLINNIWDDILRIQSSSKESIGYPTQKLEALLERIILCASNPGQLINNIWDDILRIQSRSKESIGYPTQKPEALLERIILCASNENDVILDPFVGGGTTVAVADKLKRNWIGIDQSVQAIKVSEMRLQKQQDLLSNPFVVQLHKYDYDTLRYKDAFEFESWIIQQFGGTSNTKQRSDFGIDGKTKEGIPIQVKRSDNIGRNVIDNFQSACKRFDSKLFEKNQIEKKPIGVLIAFSFGKGAIEEVARLKNHDNLLIELKKVEDIVPIAKKPKLTVIFNDLGLNSKELREIEFIATGESEAGIEFYAWDFDFNKEKGFKADILIDKIGKQLYSFKSGSYQIAIKVVDNEGLESLEILHLKINGIVHQNN